MNQTPEQLARDKIDGQLAACGWIIQNRKQIDLGAGIGVAVREYPTDVGPADYILFLDRRPVGEILSIVVYGIVPDVSFAAIVMPPVPLPSGSLRR